MSDYEIDQIRLVRHEVSAENGHDLKKVAEYYRRIENELRGSGQFKFADDRRREGQDSDAQPARRMLPE